MSNEQRVFANQAAAEFMDELAIAESYDGAVFAAVTRLLKRHEDFMRALISRERAACVDDGK